MAHLTFNPYTGCYGFEPWPPECQLKARPAPRMTGPEIEEEIKLLDRADAGDEDALHAAFCVSPTCPARR